MSPVQKDLVCALSLMSYLLRLPNVSFLLEISLICYDKLIGFEKLPLVEHIYYKSEKSAEV